MPQAFIAAMSGFPHDVHHAHEIVDEHVQRHLAADLRQALHQEVRRAHAHLQRPKRMLDCVTALAHRLTTVPSASTP